MSACLSSSVFNDLVLYIYRFDEYLIGGSLRLVRREDKM